MSADDRNTEQQPPPQAGANRHLWEINWVRDAFCIAVLVSGVLFVGWLRAIFQPVLLALLFAYLINPLIVWCEHRFRWPRSVAVTVLLLAVATMIVGTGAAILPIAVSQADELVGKMPDYLDALARRMGVSDEAVLEKLKEQGKSFLQDPVTSLSYLWDGVVTGFGVVSGVVGTATSIAIGVGLFPVYLFFFTCKWAMIVTWPDRFIPASRRDRVHDVVRKMDHAVGAYFRTRLVIALIMGVMYATGWGLVGVPYWLLVGLLGGLLGIIPYAASFAWIAAMLLRYLDLQNGIAGTSDALSVFLWPTLVFAIVQISDDWILTPWMQGRELEMSFVTIILSVLVGGAVAGLLGMLLAVPAAACLRIFWTEVVQPKLIRYAKSH